MVFTDLLTSEKSSLEKSHVMLRRHTMGLFLKIEMIKIRTKYSFQLD